MTVPTNWQLAPALGVLGHQIDTEYPGRSRASDGTVADSHHDPSSGHWPHPAPGLGAGLWVTARDITHDPAHGVRTDLIADAIRRSHDPRLKYVISFGRIASNPAYSHAADGWGWRQFDGKDPHTNHCHVEVLDTHPSLMLSPWRILTTVQRGQTEVDMLYQIAPGGSLSGAPAGTDYNDIFAGTPTGPIVISPDEWASIGYPAPMKVASWSRLAMYCPPQQLVPSDSGTGTSDAEVRAIVRQEFAQALENTHLHVDPIV